MPYSHLVKVHVGTIPLKKLKRALETGKMALTAAEVAGKEHTLHVHPEVAEKLLKAKKFHRGARFHHTVHEIEGDLHYHHTAYGHHGGSLWSWLKNKAGPWIKKHWSKEIKPIVSLALDAGAKYYPEALPAREAWRGLAGFGVRKRRSALIKGSAEAKARMARVRAAKHNGGSFLPAGY